MQQIRFLPLLRHEIPPTNTFGVYVVSPSSSIHELHTTRMVWGCQVNAPLQDPNLYDYYYPIMSSPFAGQCHHRFLSALHTATIVAPHRVISVSRRPGNCSSMAPWVRGEVGGWGTHCVYPWVPGGGGGTHCVYPWGGPASFIFCSVCVLRRRHAVNVSFILISNSCHHRCRIGYGQSLR